MVRVIHQRNHSNESPTQRTEVGEIDTRAPFQSVRAAVNLFGAVATKKNKPSLSSFKRQSSEGGAPSLPSFKKQSSALSIFSEPSTVLDKESKLMLAEKELKRLKQELESAESTKAQALKDLESANHTLEELKNTIQAVHESKQSVVAAAEALKEQIKKLEDERYGEDVTDNSAWEKELEQEREQYKIVSDELGNAKQYLTKVRQDFDAALEAKLAALQLAAEVQSTATHHKDRAAEMQKEIAAMKDSIEQVKVATKRSEEVLAKINEEKEAIGKESKHAKEEKERKLQTLKAEFDPELATSLEIQLAQVTEEIQVVQDNMSIAHESEMNSVKGITDELNEATKTLQVVAAEESELRTSVAALRLELENVKKELAEAEEREVTRDARSTDLKAQLESARTELEAQVQLNTDEHVSQLHQLTSETEEAKVEAEETKQKAQELKQEAETARTEAEESEKQLRVAMTVLDEAKSGEEHAATALRKVSTVCATDFGPGGARIRMSKKDYEVLRRKDNEAGRLAETKVTAMMFQVGVISASKNDAEGKVNEAFRELVEIQAAIDLASKQAEVAEAARRAIQSELQRWRKQEQEQKQQPQLQMCAN